MLYEIMLIGIGFLSACLCMAMLAPAIHARAVRLTVRRVLGGLPRSIIEARAHKDQLRAEFAVKIRRLEMTIADMQAKTAGGSGEVARKAAEIERLSRELRKAQVTVLRFQAHELMRRSITRTIVKLLVYLYERSQRWQSVTRGLDPRAHLFRKKVECRVEPPVNDAGLAAANSS